MKNTKKLFVSGAAVLALGGCATMPNLSPDQRILIASTWHLEAMVDSQEEVRLRPSFGDRHTLTFQRNGSLTMQLDCNRGTGEWGSSSRGTGVGSLTIGPIASTRALCPSPTYGERMAAELPQAATYELGANGQSLRIRTGNTTYSFVTR